MSRYAIEVVFDKTNDSIDVRYRKISFGTSYNSSNLYHDLDRLYVTDSFYGDVFKLISKPITDYELVWTKQDGFLNREFDEKYQHYLKLKAYYEGDNNE